MVNFISLKYRPKSLNNRTNFHSFPTSAFVNNTTLSYIPLIVCYSFYRKNEQTFAPWGSSIPLNIWRLAANSRKRSRWFPDVRMLLITQHSLSAPRTRNSFVLSLLLLQDWLTDYKLLFLSNSPHSLPKFW